MDLFTQNLDLAGRVVGSWLYRGSALPVDEAEQVARIALWEVARSYDGDPEIFRHRATRLIRFALIKAWRKSTRMTICKPGRDVEAPFRDLDAMLDGQALVNGLRGRELEVMDLTLEGYGESEISTKLGISVSRISTCLWRARHPEKAREAQLRWKEKSRSQKAA